MSKRGSDKDYYSNLFEEYKNFAILKIRSLCSKDRQ